MNEQPHENNEGNDLETNAPAADEAAAERTPDQIPTDTIGSASVASASELPTPPADAVPSWRPSDYYAAPRGPAKFPRWVPVACGIAAIVALGFMAVVGMFLQSGGLSKLIAIAFGQLNSEAVRMFDDDVDPAARASFSKSLLAVRDGIADGTIDLTAALPVLQQMQKATHDGRLSADEVDSLTTVFEASQSAPAKHAPGEPPVVDL